MKEEFQLYRSKDGLRSRFAMQRERNGESRPYSRVAVYLYAFEVTKESPCRQSCDAQYSLERVV